METTKETSTRVEQASEDILSLCIYMFNSFCVDEALMLWGGEKNDPYRIGLGWHLLDKWEGFNHDIGRFVCAVSPDIMNKLMGRALELYKGRTNRK